MRYRMTSLFVFGLIVASPFMTGCASSDVRVSTMGRSYRAKNIAVINLAGPEDQTVWDGLAVTWDTSKSEEMTQAIERALMDSSLYSVMDRGKLERIIAEQDLHKSTLVDPKTAAKAGKLAGLNGIVLVRPEGYCKAVLYIFFYVSKTTMVRMIDVETASVVWSGEVTFTDFGVVPFLPASMLFTPAEPRMARDLKHELRKEMFVW